MSSASGMAAGGRILHHIYNHVSEENATILFVGYQSAGTLGFYLSNGAKTIRIFGDTLPVKAAIGEIGGYSAHADRNELLRWLGTLTTKPRLFAVHGDPPAAEAFAATVSERLGFDARAAARGTTVTL